MNELDVKRILQQAIDTYGVEAQLDMCIEEMSELTKAICKYKRVIAQLKDKVLVMPEEAKKVNESVDNIAEETADVLIMLEQIKMIFGTSTIEKQIDYKVKRLAERLGIKDGKIDVYTKEYCTMLNEEVEIIEEKQQGRWKPKINDGYYFLNSVGEAVADVWLEDLEDNYRYLTKNVFKTMHEAREYVAYKTALLEAEKPYVENEKNWFIKFYFDFDDKKIVLAWNDTVMYQGTIYLGQDKDVAQAFVDKWEKQILKYEFGIEE